MTYFFIIYFLILLIYVSHSNLHDLIAQGLNSKCFTGSSSQQAEALPSSKEETITFDSDSSSGSSSDDEAFHE